jgi:hypothetical protein
MALIAICWKGNNLTPVNNSQAKEGFSLKNL